MKHQIPLFAFAFVLHLAATAAVPLHWTVETSRATPAQFEAYQGETLDLEADLKSSGKPLELSGIAALYWQTNGMGSAYWEATAAVNSNRLSAVWTPEMDVGAKVYNCFIGVPGTVYHAAFQLRLRPSPGADPNTLPLPVPVIDFAKVRVLNPPWEGGGGGGVNTNAVIDIIHDTVSGSARSLPKYLHERYFDDSYPEAAQEYYRSRGNGKTEGGCSAVRSGGFLYRNFDYPFDDRSEFIVKMSAGKDRFASVGVAQVGTNLTEQMVTSGKPEYSHLYKWLPGATVDGINENGVVAEINVVDGDPQWGGGVSPALHPLAAVRWVLDNATNAQSAAEYIATHIKFPPDWVQNFHYMIVDEGETWVVENGSAHMVGTFANVAAMTNFRLYPTRSTGEGQERYDDLMSGANITSLWWTLTYTSDGYRASDLPGITGEALTQLFGYWASKPREQHRGETFANSQQLTANSLTWWQTVHTSIYDITNRVLRISVQETDDWYTFALAKNGTDEAKVREIAGEVVAPVAATVSSLQSSVSGLESSKLDGPTDTTLTLSGKAADAKATGDTLALKRGMTDRSWTDGTDAGIVFTVTNATYNGYPLSSSNGEYMFYASRYDPPHTSHGDAWMVSENFTSSQIYRSGGGFVWYINGVVTQPFDLGVHDLEVASGDAKNVFTCHVEGVRKTDTLALTSEIPAPVDIIDPASATTTGKAADALAVKQALAGKQDTLSSQQLANIADVTNKANQSTTYTKTEVDTALAGKACASDLESVSSRVERVSASVNTNSESISRLYRDVDGKVVNVGGFISSSKPTHYRTGQAGELGTGWAYTAVDGNGLLKYSAFVPTPNVVVTLSGSDPVTEYFGHTFYGRDMVVELTSLTSERGDENGKYDVADFNLSMTNNLPLVISIHRNILDPIARLTGISTEHVSSMYFDTGDAYPYVHHYCYGFSSSLNLVTYYDEWWDDDGNWDTDYRSFTVTATASGESDYFLVSFGGERLLTESERGDAITELTERTGRRDEAGSGWGYKKYEFKTDRRSWIVKAPDLFAGHSNSVDRSTASNGHIKYTYSSWGTTTYEYDDCPVYTNPFGCSAVFTVTEKACLSTEGKYGTDGCSNANYRVSLKFGTSPLVATFDVLNLSISGGSPAAHFVPSSQWAFVEAGTNSYWTSRDYHNVDGDGFFCQSDTYVTSHGYKWYTAFDSFTVRIPCDVDGVVHYLTDGSAAYVPFNVSISVKWTIPGQADTSYYKFYRSFWGVDLSVSSAFKFVRTGSLSQFEIKAYDLVNDLNVHEFVDETNGMRYEAAVVGGSLVLRAVESED